MTYKPFWLALCCFCWACKGPSPDAETSTRPDYSKLEVPRFNADSAYAFIDRQVRFGPRVPNTPAHAACGKWLIQKLKSYSDKVHVQEATVTAFDGTRLDIQNIMASFNPQQQPRVLLCAHWDTRPFADRDAANPDEPIPGANDGGSGTGVLLELARQFSLHDPGIGVDILLFDAEDYGAPANRKRQRSDTWCLGSQYWSRNLYPPRYNPLYGILLDMVGAENAVFSMEGHSIRYARSTVRKVWNTAAELGYNSYFSFEETPPIIDDHYYINKLAGIPCINIVQHDPATPTRFGSYWHTHRDNMDIISKHTLEAVGETVLHVVFREAVS